MPASVIAGDMLRRPLKTRAVGEGRVEMKYDAMIAAIAHARADKYLITANARDFERYLGEVRSTVEVLRIDAPRQVGQLRLIDAAKKSSA